MIADLKLIGLQHDLWSIWPVDSSRVDFSPLRPILASKEIAVIRPFLLACTGLAIAALSLMGGSAQAQERSAQVKIKPFPREWHYPMPDSSWKKCTRVVGTRPPKIDITRWLNGRVDAGDMRGNIVVVDFWATWCRPCILSIPHNNEIYKKYYKDGVRLFGICNTRGAEKIDFIRSKHQIAYTIGVDKKDRSATSWGVQWWPYYVVIDRNGKIRAAGLAPDHVEDVVKALLKEQPLPKTDKDATTDDSESPD